MLLLYIVAVTAGYVWVTKKLCKLVDPYWAKALVVVVAILIPTADEIYGRIKLKLMCMSEGGLHIYRVVEGVEGIDMPQYPTDDKSWLSKGGYKFIEGSGRGGGYARLSLQSDGSYLLEEGITPISEYVYDFNSDYNRKRKDFFWRAEQSIRVRNTGEILSLDTNIGYQGGWFGRSFLMGGASSTCGRLISITEFVTQTLKPIQSNSTQ